MNKSKQHRQTERSYTDAYLRLKQSMVSFLRSRLDDPSVAEDIVHDAFVKALVHDSNVGIKNMDAWMKRIVRNALTDYYRAKQRGTPLPEESITLDLLEDNQQDEHIEMEIHHLFAQYLRPFVDCLPPKYAQVFIHKEYEGKTIKEIAIQLQLSQSAIKSRLARGRKLLQEQLLLCCEIELNSGFVQDFTPRFTCRDFDQV